MQLTCTLSKENKYIIIIIIIIIIYAVLSVNLVGISLYSGFFLPSATKLGQGNIFSGVCQEFYRGGDLPHCMLGHPPTPGDTATIGRYASYWNAILLMYIFRTAREVWRQTSLGSSYGRRLEPSPPLSSGR